MTPDEELKLYRIIEDRLSALYEELEPGGQGEVDLDSPVMGSMTERWRTYITGLDMRFMSREESFSLLRYDDPNRVRVGNPLYTEDEEFQIIEMEASAAEKILVLGMP